MSQDQNGLNFGEGRPLVLLHAYLDSLTRHLADVISVINSNVIGNDVEMPAALKATAVGAANFAVQLQDLLPDINRKLVAVSIGRGMSHVLFGHLPPIPSGVSTPVAPKFNCTELQQEVDVAASQGIGFTVQMREAIHRACPKVTFPNSSHPTALGRNEPSS